MKTTNNTEQVSGKHYYMEIEPVHIISEFNFNWFQGEALKYVSRHYRKNGINDLNKAIHISDMSIDLKPLSLTKNWNDNLVSRYVDQFEKCYRDGLLEIIKSLYFLPWEDIRESIIQYKEQCYGKR